MPMSSPFAPSPATISQGCVVLFLMVVIFWALVNRYRCDAFSSTVIEKLSNYNGRLTGSRDHYNSYLYLLDQVKTLRNVKMMPWAPEFTQVFVRDGIQHRNIVFAIEGRQRDLRPDSQFRGRDPYVIIMAHYDHIGPGFPGSNDNGSGVFGLLSIAERLSMHSLSYPPKHSIIFVLTDGEELGLHGSAVLFQTLNASPHQPDIIINIDTIGGYPSDSPIIIANNGNYASYFAHAGRTKKINISLVDIIPNRSDITHFLNNSTCVEFGYLLGEYHTHTDTYDNLNIPNMVVIIEVAIGLVEYISGYAGW